MVSRDTGSVLEDTGVLSASRGTSYPRVRGFIGSTNPPVNPYVDWELVESNPHG